MPPRGGAGSQAEPGSSTPYFLWLLGQVNLLPEAGFSHLCGRRSSLPSHFTGAVFNVTRPRALKFGGKGFPLLLGLGSAVHEPSGRDVGHQTPLSTPSRPQTWPGACCRGPAVGERSRVRGRNTCCGLVLFFCCVLFLYEGLCSHK